jgi:hypothetical protein
MLTSFWKRIAPELSIQMTTEMFTISNGDQSVSLPTYLYIEPTGRGHIVRSVGDVPTESSGPIRVELFGAMPVGVERSWALEAFLKHAIHEVTSGRAIIRPPVTVTGLDAFGPHLDEAEIRMLTEALVNAGARIVEFPEWRAAA